MASLVFSIANTIAIHRKSHPKPCRLCLTNTKLINQCVFQLCTITITYHAVSFRLGFLFGQYDQIAECFSFHSARGRVSWTLIAGLTLRLMEQKWPRAKGMLFAVNLKCVSMTRFNATWYSITRLTGVVFIFGICRIAQFEEVLSQDVVDFKKLQELCSHGNLASLCGWLMQLLHHCTGDWCNCCITVRAIEAMVYVV